MGKQTDCIKRIQLENQIRIEGKLSSSKYSIADTLKKKLKEHIATCKKCKA